MNEFTFDEIQELRALVVAKAAREIRANRPKRGAYLHEVIEALDNQRFAARKYLAIDNKLEDATRI